MKARPVFQLGPTSSDPAQDVSPFVRHGFLDNPFPASGVNQSVLFHDHMPAQLGTINDWLQQSQQPSAQSLRPLAVRGSLGVGKTHLLITLERGLRAQGYSVLRHTMSDKGLSRLLLADLLLPDATTSISSQNTNTPAEWVYQLYRLCLDTPQRIDEGVSKLSPDSKVGFLFRQVAAESERVKPEWVLRWFARSNVTDSQLQKMGINSPLRGEGESLRALADLVKLAVNLEILLPPWFIFLDQLEDLFRPGNVSEGRRARFLTDLRTFIDLALEGAPIANLIAWNTEVGVSLESQIQAEYRALWNRLGTPVDLPQLRREHLQSFASVYLDQALKTDPVAREHPKKAKAFCDLIKLRGYLIVMNMPSVAEASPGTPRISLRAALEAWRSSAEQLAVAEN